MASVKLTNALPFRPGPALAALLLLGAARPAAHAQAVLTNNGGTLYVNTGGTLHLNGDLAQTGAALLRTPGTTTVTGNVASAAGTTLDLSTGLLDVAGNVSAATGTTTATTGTLRLAGPANQSVSLNGGTVGQLVVNKATAGGTLLSLPTDLVAATGVTLTAGLVRTAASATLVLPAGATLSGEGPGQYVQGNLRVSRAAVAGTTDVDFGNGVVINPNGNALGTVAVTRAAGLQLAGTTFATNPGGSATNSIDRIWRITPQTQPAIGTPATLILSWPADDDGGLSTAALRSSAQAFRRAETAAPFAAVGSARNASARSLTVAAAAFSDWTVSAAVTPLPVELLAFAAERRGEAALLTWATASEKNSAYFAVEASPDGRAFRAVGQVAAQGTSTQRHAYQLTDANLTRYAAPLVYYRLRQVDRDGTASYSPVRTVAVGPARLALFPNPAHGGTTTLTGAQPGATVVMYDALGRKVLAAQADTVGSAALLLPAGHATGVYVVRVDGKALRLTVE